VLSFFAVIAWFTMLHSSYISRIRNSHYVKNPLGEKVCLSAFKGFFSLGVFAKQAHLLYLENIALVPLKRLRNLFGHSIPKEGKKLN
jgi:hypothetical protein